MGGEAEGRSGHSRAPGPWVEKVTVFGEISCALSRKRREDIIASFDIARTPLREVYARKKPILSYAQKIGLASFQ